MRIPRFTMFACALLAALSGGSARRLQTNCKVDRPETTSWYAFVLSEAPATLRVPPEPHGEVLFPEFQDTWLTRHWELRVDVSSDSTSAPFAQVGTNRPPVRVDVHECVDTVAKRPMHIVSYRQPSGELHGEYVVVADWPLAPGSWLRIGGVAADSDDQRVLEAIVRTLQLNSAAPQTTAYHPQTTCEFPRLDTREWRRLRLRYAPVTLSVPADAESKLSSVSPDEVLNWSHGTINFQYRVLRTPGWQLPKPAGTGALWCRLDVDGHDGEIAIDSVLPRLRVPMLDARAYVRLGPGLVLAIESQTVRSGTDAKQQVLGVLGSIRVE